MINTYKIKRDVYLWFLSLLQPQLQLLTEFCLYLERRPKFLSFYSSYAQTLVQFFLLPVWPIVVAFCLAYICFTFFPFKNHPITAKLQNYYFYQICQQLRGKCPKFSWLPITCLLPTFLTNLWDEVTSLHLKFVCPTQVPVSASLILFGRPRVSCLCWIWKDEGECLSWHYISGMDLVHFSCHFLALSHPVQQMTYQRQNS